MLLYVYATYSSNVRGPALTLLTTTTIGDGHARSPRLALVRQRCGGFMSVRVMALVWDSTVPAPERFTLLALADRADEDGVCWPSRATLARKCRTSESTIRKHLKTLEAEGVLHIQSRRIEDRHNDSNMYRIDLAKLKGLVDNDDHPARKTPTESRPTPTEIRPRVESAPGSNLGPPPTESRPRGGPNKDGGVGRISDPIHQLDPSVDPSVIHHGARSARQPRATRLPEDFTVTAEMVAWARANVPHVDGRLQTDMFIDHFRAASGANASKQDWVAAWRNWMRKAPATTDRGPAFRPAVNGSAPQQGTSSQRANAFLALRKGDQP